MSDSTFSTPPELAEMLSSQFDEPEDTRPNHDHVFVFDKLPRDIKTYLDRYVIQQQEAKKVLSIAVCDHYNHIKHLRALTKDDPERAKQLEYVKQNVILIGPTGVGKTYLFKHIAELIGVPFVKADATKFSETGYVGGDVEDLVRDLVHKADGDIELAQYGIIYIDEIDKIAAPAQQNGRDVSGRGVQTTLLKLMEETDVPVRSQNDIQAQLQAAMEFQRSGQRSQAETVNMRNILFIVSGAFEKLPELIAHRLQKPSPGADGHAAADLTREASTRDFIAYGFEPEFIGRLPVRVVCEPLRVDDFYEIMERSEGSILRQYERAFRAYGIEVSFAESALREIARQAAEEKTGARGLLTVCERILRDFKYELPGSEVKRFTVDGLLIAEPQRVLQQLLVGSRVK